MFSSISNYLFGSYSDENGPENLAENLITTEPNGSDWILVDTDKKEVTSVGGIGQLDVNLITRPSKQPGSIIKEKPKDDEDKENDSSDDASSISSLSESSSNEYDSENEMVSFLDTKSAKKVKKPRKPRFIVDDHNGFNAGLMDGSWFITPPPCFIRHKKSQKRQMASSPMEDMLIEHPSISVYQANTSTNSSNNLPQTTNLPTNTPFDYLIEAFDYFPSLTAISKNVAWSDWNGPKTTTTTTRIKVPSARFIYKPSPSSAQRKTSKKHINCSNRQQSTSQQNGHNQTNNIFNLLPEVNQPHASCEFRAINTNTNQSDRNEYLQEINNLQYNLAPMQKAMNQGSQKFLKKSYLNRQNLVKFRSDRQGFTQRPKCHPLKMC